MKKSELRKIIKEELQKLNESYYPDPEHYREAVEGNQFNNIVDLLINRTKLLNKY